MILAALVGAALSFAASIRGRFRVWPVVAAPFLACLVNLGAMYLLARLVLTWAGAAQQPWTKLLSGAGLVAFGIFLAGAFPAILTSLLFQIHCRYRLQPDLSQRQVAAAVQGRKDR